MDIALATTHLKNITELPTALIDDVCFGVAELPAIFEKYGFTPESAEQFREDPVFKRVISIRTAELDKEGLTHRVRASMVADTALATLARRVVDPNTPTTVLLDAYKAVAKNAGLEPRANDVQSTGAKFSIQINLPSHSDTKQSITIDVTPEQTMAPIANPAEFEVIE
jgi:hypothetical protein